MAWFRSRRSREADLSRELEFHLEALVEDLMRTGVPRPEALRRARLTLGGLDQVKEATRDVRPWRFLEDWWRDTGYALRSLRRTPGFTAAAVMTLAIGIGANTAVFSVLDALVLRSLPVDRSEELYAVRRQGNETSYIFSHPRIQRLQGVLPDSVRLGAMSSISRMYLATGSRSQPQPALTQLVSGNWFHLLGVRASAGRVFGPVDDGAPGSHPVAVLSDAFWARRFGRSQETVGSTIQVNGASLTIVGIAEPAFTGLTVGTVVDLWIPLVMQHDVRYSQNAYSSSNSHTDQPWLPQDGIHWLTPVSRVTSDARAQVETRLQTQFRAELEQETASLDSAERAHRLKDHLALEPLAKGFSPLRAQFQNPLRALLAGVGLVLMIACANLASLLLARGSARSQELSVRVALGARPGRLLRQALAESTTLALLGGLGGAVLAWWGGLALLRLASTGSRGIPLALARDLRMFGFVLGLALLTGALFGIAPALRSARRARAGATLRPGGRSGGRAAGRLPLGRVLVVTQLALSLVLVTAAGLLVRTLKNLVAIDPGYHRDQVIEVRMDPRAAGYRPQELQPLYRRLRETVGAVPGIQSVGLALTGLATGFQRIGGYSTPGAVRSPDWNAQAQENLVTPGYFATVGIPLLRGRDFTELDRTEKHRVAIVSQSFARHFFDTEDVVGRRFGYHGDPIFEIIGVVKDARINALKEAPPRMVYQPISQEPADYLASVEARTTGATRPLLASVRRAIASVDPALPIREIVTVEDLLERGLLSERMLARLASGFSIMALLLAAVGLYGVVAYSVTQRTGEMGIRMALGAVPWKVWRLVMKDSLAMVALGLLLGLALWYPVQGLVRNLMYGVSPRDPATALFAVAVLAGVGLLAASLPALRAARVDPARALRSE